MPPLPHTEALMSAAQEEILSPRLGSPPTLGSYSPSHDLPCTTCLSSSALATLYCGGCSCVLVWGVLKGRSDLALPYCELAQMGTEDF